MHHHHCLKLSLIPLLVFAAKALATDYGTNGGDPGVGATWVPDASPIISGGNIIPAAGDRLLINGGDLAGGQIIINSGASLNQIGAGQHNIRTHVDLAGTGTDGLGAFQNLGNDWVNMTDVRLTGDATVRVQSGGWRHDAHGTANNIFNLNGNTLTVTGANSWYFVNTNVVGPGTMNVNIGGEFNFEASSILPADVTMNLTNTRSSSWDGAGRTMLGDISLNNSILENRQNDGGKTYAGTITLINQGTLRVTTENNTSNNFMVVSGQITGSGKLVRDGIATENVFLNNGTNNYTGGTDINSGSLILGAAGAIPAGSNINVNSAGRLDLSTFNQDMGSGSISGTVTGTGTLNLTPGGITTINQGAVINNGGGVNLKGGTLATLGSGVFSGISGNLVVSENSTLMPSNQGLAEYHRTGANLSVDDGTAGATWSGVRDGIPAIDSTAKPYGDNNKFIYTGRIINTTGSDIGITFGEQYDDEIRVKVDGSTVLYDTGWNNATASGLVNLAPGAHDIEISSWDGGGGAGPNSGWDKGVGIAVGPYTITDLNGGGDNAAFSRITAATLPAGLVMSIGDVTETKDFTINSGKTLTVDTSNMIGGDYVLSGNISGTGRIAKTGDGRLVLSGITTNRSAVVSGGSLALDGTHAFTSISVAGGATLEGSGSAAFSIANISVGGAVAPGTDGAVGNLTLAVASINGEYAADVSADAVNDMLTGDVIWGDTGEFTLTLLSGYVPAINDSWDFIDGFIDGPMPALNLPDLGFGKMWVTDQFLSDGILTVVVPEPSAAFLGLAGAALLLRRRRR